MTAASMAQAAVAHVQSKTGTMTGSAVSTANVTLGAAVTSGNSVLVTIVWGQSIGVQPTSVVDNKSNSYTLKSEVFQNNAGNLAVYGLNNITNGPSTITVTTNGLANFIQVGASEYSGGTINQSTATSISAPGTGTDAVTTGTFGAGAGDTIWGASANQNTQVTTVGTNFALRTQDTSGSDWYMTLEDHIAGGNVAATVTATTGTGFWFIGAISLTPTAGASTGLTLPLMGVGK